MRRRAFQQWVHNGKPAILIRDMARYYRIDAAQRVALQARVEPAGLVAAGAAGRAGCSALVVDRAARLPARASALDARGAASLPARRRGLIRRC